MMRIARPLLKIFVSLAAVLWISVPQPTTAQMLTFNTEEWFPYNYMEDGAIAGTSTALVHMISKRAGIKYTMALQPWALSYNNALHLPDHCVFSTNVTRERLPLFKWVKPLENARWVVYKLRTNPLVASSLDDLKDKTFGGYLGDAIAVFLKSQGFKVEEAASDHINPYKLEKGEIDVWATYDSSGLRLAKERGIEIEAILTVRNNELALACNKHIDDAIIAKLQNALDNVNTSGEADEIRRRKF